MCLSSFRTKSLLKKIYKYFFGYRQLPASVLFTWTTYIPQLFLKNGELFPYIWEQFPIAVGSIPHKYGDNQKQ